MYVIPWEIYILEYINMSDIRILSSTCATAYRYRGSNPRFYKIPVRKSSAWFNVAMNKRGEIHIIVTVYNVKGIDYQIHIPMNLVKMTNDLLKFFGKTSKYSPILKRIYLAPFYKYLMEIDSHKFEDPRDLKNYFKVDAKKALEMYKEWFKIYGSKTDTLEGRKIKIKDEKEKSKN